jgi:predicted secreted hydrolase
VEGRLLFTAWSEALEFRGGLESGVATRHYEQPGSVAGTLTVDGQRYPLAGRGLRDHSWGVRDWQGVPYWRWFAVVVDPDTFLMVNNVGRNDGEDSVGGFLMRNGVLAPVVACNTESQLDPELGCQRSFELDVTDERERRTNLRGTALEVAPLRQRRDGRTTLVNEGLTEYDWEGTKGVGISEYLVQETATKGQDGAGA